MGDIPFFLIGVRHSISAVFPCCNPDVIIREKICRPPPHSVSSINPDADHFGISMDLRALIPKDAQAFRTKTIDKLMECTGGEHALRRVLSPLDLTLMGIGAIIGTGIFVITGVVAANYSGPALVVSFGIAGIVCAFAALAYAEFAAMVPVAGSAYTYSYASLGEIWAWIIGWDLILEYAVSIAAVAVGWSGYVTSLAAGAGITLTRCIGQPARDKRGTGQYPGDGDHPAGHRPAHYRCAGKCPGQYGDRRNKTWRDPSLPVPGLRPYPACQLGTLHAIWLERGHHRGRNRLFCLHRFRCSLDCR